MGWYDDDDIDDYVVDGDIGNDVDDDIDDVYVDVDVVADVILVSNIVECLQGLIVFFYWHRDALFISAPLTRCI